MPASLNQTRKLDCTALCQFAFTEAGCANSAVYGLAPSPEGVRASPEREAKYPSGDCSCSDDSTSVCSEETCSATIGSTETASLCDVMAPTSRLCWADARDDEEDDEWQPIWAPCPQPVKCELPVTPAQHHAAPGTPSRTITKAALKAERRKLAAAAAEAKRAALTCAVLEGLLRQARGPDVYED